jgi:hypothetical protein
MIETLLHAKKIGAVAFYGALLVSLACLGCAEPSGPETARNDKVFGETTDEVGEGEAGEPEADLQVKPNLTSPITAPLQSYGSAVSTIAKQKVQQGIGIVPSRDGRVSQVARRIHGQGAQAICWRVAQAARRSPIQIPGR